MNRNLFDGPGLPPGAGTGDWLTAHCDGGSRGNPGPAGYGAVIEDTDGRIVARLSEYLGKQTNNYAEYAGLLAVLGWALKNGHKRMHVLSDSELMVKQMRGQYKVANPGLKPLWEEARRLAGQLDGFDLKHTLRNGNKEADKLANDAMDRGMGKTPAASGGATHAAAASSRNDRHGAAKSTPQSRPERQVLEGYVKDGVVHLLEGELPDGIFVKVVRE